MAAAREQCQIYLVLDVVSGVGERLAAALDAAPIASVLFRGRSQGAATVKPLIEKTQKHGTAALVADDAALARTTRADGVHLGPGADLMERYDVARDILGRGAIVGVDAGGSRHLAMEAGEAGADYIAFGDARVELEPTDEVDDGADEPASASTSDLIAWWSEIFEVPCVAMDASGAETTEKFRDVGADFVAVTIGPGMPVSDVYKLLKETQSRLEADR